MHIQNECKKIINRLVAAYDVKTVKALSEMLDTTVSVIGNRVARNTIPYDLIVKCSIDTGAKLQWLLNGEGEQNIEGIMFFNDECKNVLSRIIKSYGFTTVKALGEKWGITSGVLASRVQRNTFPYDYVLRCALETGADLIWLCTGEGDPKIDKIKTEKKSIELSSEDLEKLQRIAALKKDGAITDDEYILLKSSIFKVG